MAALAKNNSVLARRWGVDKIEFGDDDGEPLLTFSRGEGEIEVDVLDVEDAVTLNYDDVVRLRDWLTVWLNAAP
jgi:hypothetical protein